MTKKKIFTGLLVLTVMTGAFSFALERGDMGGIVANILGFDALTAEEFAPAGPVAKVKRKDGVDRAKSGIFFDHENLKEFRAQNGIVNGSMAVEQARRDIENTDMRFEDTE